MAEDESHPSLYRVLVERCNDLEASHENLNQQLNKLKQDGPMSFSGDLKENESGLLQQYFKTGQGRSPYEHVLQSIGHAVHVTSVPSGEITYWNRSAERLYGWKDCEVMGRRELDFLIDREYAPTIDKIKERLHTGQSWSEQAKIMAMRNPGSQGRTRKGLSGTNSLQLNRCHKLLHPFPVWPQNSY